MTGIERRRNVQFRRIFETIHSALAVLDPELCVRKLNPAFETLFELRSDAVQGKSLFELNDEQWNMPRLRHILEHMISHDLQIEDFEFTYRFAADDVRSFLLNASYFTADDGITSILIEVHDVTPLKQAESKLEQQIVQLADRNEELDAFARSVAHDLKTPIASIVGNADLIRSYHERMSKEEMLENLQNVIEDGNRATEIINALLLLAGVSRSEVMNPEPLDTPEIIKRAEDRLSSFIRENEAQLVIAEEWQPAIGYTPWIEEVWVNYISNAVKYGGKPPVIRLGSTVESDERVRFWVQDNGRGLNDIQKASVFTPFTRLQPKRAEGHGLGLAVVERIVTRLGGRVGVESTPNQGSTFSFTLPRYVEAAPHAAK